MIRDSKHNTFCHKYFCNSARPRGPEASATAFFGDIAEDSTGLTYWLAALAALAFAYELARRDLRRLRAAAPVPLPESAAFPPAEQP